MKRNLCAHTIGEHVMSYMEDYDFPALAQRVDSDAVKLVAEVKAILDDRTLDDPECFERIEAIIDAFYTHGLWTTRHDEYE